MSDAAENGGITDDETLSAIEGLADAVSAITQPGKVRTMVFAKGENIRHIRHEQVLRRWPILPEDWARKVEATRLAAVDRTPGAATFGR